ncbi:MAG: caspase family protein [Bacteroidales bacterium]|nr:caspase family protein [Bacteroidales bacterium]
MKWLKANTFILLSLFILEGFSQTNVSPSLIETQKYIENSFENYQIDIKELKTYYLNSKKYASIYDYKSASILKKDYNGNLYFEYYSDDGYNSVSCTFNIINVEIGKIVSTQTTHSFSISCKSSQDCIKLEKSLLKKITITSPNNTIISRFRNSLIHLQTLSNEIPGLASVVKDPFDEHEVKELNDIKISIPNIKYEDINKNNRIDETEKTSLIISLQNHNQRDISNISIEIKELNKIKGLVFQEKHNIQTLTSNQTRNIEIKIESNNELQIGEANFEIKVLSNNVEITKKTVKIATFNSGPQEILISKLPEIDLNIPKTSNLRRNTYAIVIGNEDYKSKQPNLSYETNVKYAENDAKIFKEYLINTLGIPNTNITYLTNATSAQIKQAINKVKQLPLVNSNAEIIFYYAGHGLPDEKTKEQYIIPVDVNSSNLSFGIKINEIESELSSNNPKRVLLILDACFSGAARNESLLSNRAVRVRPKENVIKGNSIILSASSNEEASKAYDEMQHGMFTYFLLKKLQETKGNVDLQTLFDFLYFNVREKSLLINNQFQTPTITKSPQIQNNLNEIKF